MFMAEFSANGNERVKSAKQHERIAPYADIAMIGHPKTAEF